MRTSAEWIRHAGHTPDGVEALRQAEVTAHHPEDWLRIAEFCCGEGLAERAQAAIWRAVPSSVARYGVNPLALYRSAELLAKRLGDREGAAEVLRRFELGLDPYGRPFDWGMLAKAHLSILADERAADRCLDEGVRRTDSPDGLARLAEFFVECGRTRERALELLEHAEASHPLEALERDFWSIMTSWQRLGEEERARSLLERITRESEPVEVLRKAALVWWVSYRDADGVRRALARAEPRTVGAEAWLALAESYRDGGESERPVTWNPGGVRRCLERALTSNPTSAQRTAIAAGFRRWLGDEVRAAELAETRDRGEPRARVREALSGWDGTRPFELFELLRDRLGEDELDGLAAEDSHQDVARHREGLEEIVRARRLELPLQSHPLRALEVASWGDGERTHHGARAFACTLLLLDGGERGTHDTLAPLVQSAWILGLDEELERFLAWLTEVVRIHDLGCVLLGIALTTARRDPHAPELEALVDRLAELAVHHTNGCVDPDWVYPAEYGTRKAMWATLVEEALGGAGSTEVDRLRALLLAPPPSSGPPASEPEPRDTIEPPSVKPLLTLLLRARDHRDEPEERDRALAGAARIAVTAHDLVDVAYYLGWLGGDRALGAELAERGETMALAGGDHLALWRVAMAWKYLGDEARGRAMLLLGVERTRDASVAGSLATAWRSLFDDDDGVRQALARGEEVATTARAWLDLAEGYRDGGDGGRSEPWHRGGIERCLERALESHPGEADRTAIAHGFRVWLGDEARADAIAPVGRAPTEVARLRKAVGPWDTSDPYELLRELAARVSEAQIDAIAAADYGSDIPKHREAIVSMLRSLRVPSPLPWHPLEVVSLTRWSTGPKTDHVCRALSCVMLLLAQADETTCANSIAPLVESAWRLELDEPLERFLAWLAEVLPVGEHGWALLGLAACVARRSPESPLLATSVDQLVALAAHRSYGCLEPDWAYPADYGQRNEMWAAVVEEALAGASGAQVEELRALLGGV